MLIDMRTTVDGLATGTFTVRRRPPPTKVKGKVVQSPENSFTIKATIGPVGSGRELERLLSGSRVEDLIQVVTTSNLRTESVSGEADRIEYGDYLFKVEEVQDWSAVGGFWRVVARRWKKIAED